MKAIVKVTYVFDNNTLKRIAKENCIDFCKENKNLEDDLSHMLHTMRSANLEDYCIDAEDDICFE